MEEAFVQAGFAIVGLSVLGMLAQLGMNFMTQRGMQHTNEMGLQAIVASNQLKTVDKSMEDKKEA